MFKDFRYSFLFLGKFLLVYFGANLLYGFYIDSFQHAPDTITYWVSDQISQVQNLMGIESSIKVNEGKKSISMRHNGDSVINVFEGCNGVNVMIVFVAFMIAFGGSTKRMIWFVPAGLFIIHIFNLLRIILLYLAAQHNSQYFYYIHKYFFTAVLYLVVIGLWIIWVTRLSIEQPKKVD